MQSARAGVPIFPFTEPADMEFAPTYPIQNLIQSRWRKPSPSPLIIPILGDFRRLGHAASRFFFPFCFLSKINLTKLWTIW
jgi:hypothetical protein